MSKRILSIVVAMFMLIPMVLGLTSCSKERTEEEIINDIVNSGTIALTLSIWIPTNSDTESVEFNERLNAVEAAFNEILRDKNYSTEIELTAISSNEYEAKLAEHLAEIEKKVEHKKGLLPSSVSQNYVNKAVKVHYGENSYMYELSYPDVLETQLDLFMIRSYDEYKSLVQTQNLHKLDLYLSKLGGHYADIHKMISPAVFSQYAVGGSTYAIPNNHQYTNANYQYLLIDKAAFDSVEELSISDIKDVLSCEAFINAISENKDYVPFVGNLNDAPGVMYFDDMNLVGSSVDNALPSSIFDVEAYTKYVELYKKLSDNKLVKNELADGEKAAVSFFYGTNEEIKAYENDYYVVKTEKPVAYVEDIFSSMFAISKYSANYDRAMKILYLLQTNSELITLLQYGIEGEDYKIEFNDNDEEVIKVSSKTAYNMSGLNIGNSYHTYKNDGATLDEWALVKDSNYDLLVNPYLHLSENYEDNATEEEKSQLLNLVNAVNALASEVTADVNSMSYEAYVEFLAAYNELATLYPEVAGLEKEIAALNEAMKPNKDKLAALESEISVLEEALKATTDRIAAIETELETLRGAEEADADKISALEEELAYLNSLVTPDSKKLEQLETELAMLKDAEAIDEELVSKLESEIEIVKNATSLKTLNAEASSLKEKLKPNEEKLAELEEKYNPLNEKKNTLETNCPSAAKLRQSDDLKKLIDFYTELYNKYK